MTSPQDSHEIDDLVVHDTWLRRVALRIVRDANTAEDLVQETWVAALRNPRARSPKSWLRQVLFNRLNAHWRRSHLRADSEVYASCLEPCPPAELDLMAEEAREQLVHAVEALVEPYRGTVLAYYFGGRTSVQIARGAGVPEGTVRWRLKRGREQVKRALRDAGG